MKKKQRITSLLMSVLMLVSTIVQAVPSFGEELNTEVETQIQGVTEVTETDATESKTADPVYYTVTLPDQEHITFVYDTSHIQAETIEKGIRLYYETGDSVNLGITTDTGYKVEETKLISETTKEAVVIPITTDSFSFIMPEQNLIMQVTYQEIAPETENQTEDETRAGPETEAETAVELEPETEDEMQQKVPVTEETSLDVNEKVETEESTEQTSEVTEIIMEETEADGLPLQGSIVQTDPITIPYDTWDFDPKADKLSSILQGTDETITYISDDIIYDVPGLYNSIYRVDDTNSGKFWFVLRPVIVSEEAEIVETEDDTQERRENETSEGGIETEYESETTLETETESETDLGQKSETVVESGKNVYLLENEYYTISLAEDTSQYQPGNIVSFTVTPAGGTIITDTKVSVCKPVDNGEHTSNTWDHDLTLYDLSEADQEAKEEETAAEENQTKEPEGITLTSDTIAVTQNAPAMGSGVSAAIEYEFVMPDEDVVIESKIDQSISAMAETDNDTEIDSLKLTIGSAAIGGQLAWVPGKLMNNNGFSNIKYVTLYDTNGNQIDKVLAYCLNPSLPGPSAGNYDSADLDLRELANDIATYDTTVSDSSKSRKLARAMYYLYKGPAWGKTVTDLNGNSVNFKQMMIDAGCADATSGKGFNIYDDFYFITHIVLAYINDPNGKWNYAWGASDAAVANTLNAKGIALVKAIADSIGNMPSATTELSDDALSGSFESSIGANRTPSVTYTANEDNVAKITLPTGTSLVNETAGKTLSGTVTIHGGDTFYLTVPTSVVGKVTYNFKTTFAIDFSAYRIVNPNKQDIGFAFKSGGNTLSLIVDWPSTKVIELQKKDKDTGKSEAYNNRYSFAGAEYGIYSDVSCKNMVSSMTTNEAGYAKSKALSIATYYVKETKAPTGYELDLTVYTADLGAVSGNVVSIVSTEVIKRKQIELQKIDSETNKPETYNNYYSFANAQYGIYSDKNTSQLVETITTNQNGYAISSLLAYGTYYVKEITAPTGYLLDDTLHMVELEDKTVNSVKVTSTEVTRKKQITLQKVDAETKKLEPYNANYSIANAEYGIYADVDCTTLVEVLTTDSSGYAISSNLVFSKYYLKEIKAPTGYRLDPKTYSVTLDQNSVDVVALTSEEEPIKKPIEIHKYDQDTKEAKPNNSATSFEGATYRVCADEECEKVIETLITNKDGTAMSSDLPFGTYYVKETKAPTGYNLDTNTYRVDISDDATPVYIINSVEPVIRGGISLMKYLDETTEESKLQEWIENHLLEGIRFTLHHEDPSVPAVDAITTDRYGYATTGDHALAYGTWYITEDETTTPAGYEGLKNASVMITEQGVELKYVAVNTSIKSRVKIVKKDVTNGNVITRNEAAFQILDENNEPIVMPNNLDVSELTDTFTTNKSGEILLAYPLSAGHYTLVEVIAPEGYVLADPIPFEVTAGGTFETPLVIECFDKPQMGQIKIAKLDDKTNLALGEGYSFEVRIAKDITDDAGTIRTMLVDGKEVVCKAGTFVATINTDDTGTAMTDPLYLGSYVVTETASAEHYAVNTKEYPVTLSADGTVQTVEVRQEITDQKTSLDLFKVDSEPIQDSDLPLEGITFRMFTANDLEAAGVTITGKLDPEILSGLGSEYVTDETGHIQIEDLRHNTTYYIYESKTLPGYNLEDAIYRIPVDEKGLIDGQPSYSLKIANTANLVEITKKDITGDLELPGATLTVKDQEGTVVDTWVSTEEPHKIKGLAAGEYTLIEEQAPAGYAIAEEIVFTLTDSLQVQQVVMYDKQLVVAISKKDITNQEELPGAQLTITDETGSVIESWTSTTEPHLINIAVGTYTLTEIAAPEKYATAESITFSVLDDLSIQKVEMFDAPLQVEISKKDITNGAELPGAKLSITDREGNEVEQWISTTEAHKVTLAAGTYTLTEIAAPEKYSKAESIVFEVTDTADIQKVEMFDQPIDVVISKQDITSKEELPGAELTITDLEGTVMEAWTSTKEPHHLNLAAGTYQLTEIAAPDTYAKAETIIFEVTDTMDVQAVVMYDQHIQVSVSKKDITNDEELPGATLIIKDDRSNTIDEWISAKDPHLITLAAGIYTLTEVTAPDGYDVAETITFEVTDNMEIQPVTMYDAPKDETVDLTGKTDKKTTTPGMTPGSSSGTTQVVSAPVKTGDYNRYLPAILFIICGLSGLSLVILFRKKEKQDKNNQ